MGVSQLLGARARAPPKVYAYVGEKVNQIPVYRDQSSKMGHKMGHNLLGIARQVLQSYAKCVGRQEARAGHRACKHKPETYLEI